MYLRFKLSYRDVEDLLAERGIEVTYETIRRWVMVFGPMIARRLRAQRPKPHRRWHLDEIFVRIGGRQMYLWRAVDAEGEVLEVLVQARRDACAAAKLMRKLLRRQGILPDAWVTDKCRAYGAALHHLGLGSAKHITARRQNNRAESSHVPIRPSSGLTRGSRGGQSRSRWPWIAGSSPAMTGIVVRRMTSYRRRSFVRGDAGAGLA
jgi:transposase-like protein